MADDGLPGWYSQFSGLAVRDAAPMNMLLNFVGVDCISESFHASENSLMVPNTFRYIRIS